MSMPVITPSTGTRDQAVTDIIQSVALEQTALSHILNAEGEKIQMMLAIEADADKLLETNKSVESMVKSITNLEMVLQSKLSLFGDCLCNPSEEEVEEAETEEEEAPSTASEIPEE